jgi:UDP-3-O-[3-hydroxymyristoyl] glucosamine N-acyltransferase
MVIGLSEIARLVDGQLHATRDIQIRGADTIRDAREGDITFVDDARRLDDVASCAADAVLTPPGCAPDGIAYITVTDVHAAFTKIVALFRPPRENTHTGVSEAAVVSPTARLDPSVVVHPLAVIEDDVEIGAGSVIHSGVRVLQGCKLGEGVVLFPNAVLYENTVVGSRSIIHAGAVIGAYGFGYDTVDGQHQLCAQLGNVVLGQDVEIGACTTVDRATYGTTHIGDGTKIDNHVMIGHNCRIGRHNILCSQVGIAGSTTTGDYVVMAGQVGIRDHVHIGDQARLGAKAGVMSDIPAGTAYVGAPATPERQQMQIFASMMKLPGLRKQVREIQRSVDRLEKASSTIPSQEAA